MANATDSDSSKAGTGVRAIVTIILIIAFIVAIIVNVIVIFVFCRVRRLRRPAFYLVLNLAVADLICALFWVLFCIIAAAQWEWTIGDGMCKFQGFVAYLGLAFNMHTMLAIAVEKFMRIWFPSKHVDAFQMRAVVVVLLMGLWLFDLVIAMLPLVGWSEYNFYDYQFQCAIDHIESVSHLHFMFVVVIALPFVCGIVLYLLVVNKVRNLGQKVTPTGEQVLREYEDVPKESFAEKLQRQQEKFRFAAMKKKEKKPELARDGESAENSDEEYDDPSDNETYEEGGAVYTYEEARRQRLARAHKKKQRLYIFKRHDFTLAMNMWLAWVVYFILWFPYIVVGYLWIYELKMISDGLYTAVTCFIFFGLLCKPFIYVINKQLRTGLIIAFKRDKKKKSDTYSKNEPTEKDTIKSSSNEKTYSSTTTNREQTADGGYKSTTTTTTTTTTSTTRRAYYDD